MTQQQQGECTPLRGAPSTVADSINPDAVRRWLQPFQLRANEIGPVPLPGSAAWCALDDRDLRKWAALGYGGMWWCDQHSPAALAERAEVAVYLDHSAQRQASIAVSLAGEWALGNPSHAELLRRRAVHLDRPPIDHDALRRWIDTGHSEEQDSNAA